MSPAVQLTVATQFKPHGLQYVGLQSKCRQGSRSMHCHCSMQCRLAHCGVYSGQGTWRYGGPCNPDTPPFDFKKMMMQNAFARVFLQKCVQTSSFFIKGLT